MTFGPAVKIRKLPQCVVGERPRRMEASMASEMPTDQSGNEEFARRHGSDDSFQSMTPEVVIPSTRLSPRRLPSTTIDRPDVIQTVRRRRDARVVRICAPPSWGKTTLLTQWRAAELDEADGRETCWLTADGSDHTVDHFLAALVQACADGIASFGLRWQDFAPSPGVVPKVAVIPVLVDELAVTADRALIVLDDLHLALPSIHEAIGYMIQILPSNVQLAYATVERLPLHLGRLSMLGDVAEIGVDALRFDRSAVRHIAERDGVDLSIPVADVIMARTEGWPAGAAAAVRMIAAAVGIEPEAGAVATGTVGRLSGRDRAIAALLDEQVITQLDEADLKMLLHASLLDEVTCRLIDAVVGPENSTDSANRMRRLAASGGFVMTVDSSGDSYRLHPLFREALRGLLEDTTPPEQLRELHRRAATEFGRSGNLNAAITHSVLAEQPEIGSVALAAELPQLLGEPGLATLRFGVDRLGAGGATDDVPLQICAAMLHGLSGSATLAAASLRAADHAEWSGPVPGGWASVDDAVAIIHGSFLDEGLPIERVVETAQTSLGGTHWWSWAHYAAGRRSYLAGDLVAAREWFESAARAVERPSADPAPGVRLAAALSSSYLAIIAIDERRTADADAALESALAFFDDPAWLEQAVTAPLHLARGVIDIAADRPGDAKVALATVRDRSPRSSSTRLHALLELTRAAELDGDLTTARLHLAEAEVIAPELEQNELLTKRLAALVRLLHPATLSQADLITPITDGEMAVLRRVPSDQTQVEIARSMHLSINTVKSHLRSIYQKLGVSSRPAAVRRARALGLLLEDLPGDDPNRRA